MRQYIKKRDESNICVLKSKMQRIQAVMRAYLYVLPDSGQNFRGKQIIDIPELFLFFWTSFFPVQHQTSKGQILYFFKFSMSKKPTKANNRINTGINTRGRRGGGMEWTRMVGVSRRSRGSSASGRRTRCCHRSSGS
jgi:hypothetical protein